MGNYLSYYSSGIEKQLGTFIRQGRNFLKESIISDSKMFYFKSEQEQCLLC